MENKLTAADLFQFTGTENYYRHPLIRSLSYTDGVRYVAEKGSAWWLIDAIASHQLEPKVKREEFQVWTLKKDSKTSSAVLECQDGNYTPITKQEIPFTDFPLDKVSIWLETGVMLLPSEH